jgi:predicted nucleic-acid-binding protein
MANRRELKKDINYITEEVIADCLLFVDINPDKDKEAIANIINNIIDKRNELIHSINHLDKSMDRSATKSKFKNIAEELLDTANTSFEELSKLAKK